MDLNTVSDWLKGKMGYVPQPEKQLPEGSSQGIKGSDLPLVLGMIGGPMALGANMSKYREAAKAVLNKDRPTNIFNKTGWFQRQPGQLAFEIPDRGVIARPLTVPGGDRSFEGYMGNVIHHPEFFKNYPNLQYMKVRVGPQEAPHGEGWYNGDGLIGVGGPVNKGGLTRDQLGVLLHEGQHGVQGYEKWGGGATAEDLGRLTLRRLQSDYYKYPEGTAERDAIAKLLRNTYKNKDSLQFKMYIRNPNETEARNVENRYMLDKYNAPIMNPYYSGDFNNALKINPAQAKYPWKTEDIPRDQQFDYGKLLGGQ